MSEFFAWDPQKYSVHVPQMDRDHGILVGYMNDLHALHEAGANKQALGEACRKLVDYTRKHFAGEEAYMEQINYPDRRVHAVMHKQLLGRIDHFAQEFAAKGRFTEEFFVFLKTWLKAHICGIDIKYGRQSS